MKGMTTGATVMQLGALCLISLAAAGAGALQKPHILMVLQDE